MTDEQQPFRQVLTKSLGWSTLDVIVGRLGQFVQGVIVARLIAPRYFGVFAIALVVHMIVVNVSELGVSAALIRDDPAQSRRAAPTVATISLVTSAVLAAIVVLLAPVLATSLGSAQAAGPIRIMALNLPLAAITAVPAALVKRDFRMDRLFVADFANLIVTGVVVVLLAIAGWRASALAWSWVAGQAATAVILLSYRYGGCWPGWDRREARHLLSFGLPLAAGNILGFLVLNVDYVVVGHLLGPVALGFYLLAFNISGWPISFFGTIINSVSLPGFSRLRLDGEHMPAQFVRALRIVSGATLPICLIIGALATSAVTAIYGARWAPAAAALGGLSVLAAGRILLALAADFLVTLGRTKGVMLAQIPWLICLSVALALVAPRYGIRGVGITQAVVVVAIVGPIYLLLLSRAGVRSAPVLRTLLPPLLWGVAAAGTARLVASTISEPLLACLFGAAAGMLVVLMRRLPALARGLIVARARENRRGLRGTLVDAAHSVMQI